MVELKQNKSKRIYELDALRGFAALAVVFFHYTVKYNEIFTPKVMDDYVFNYGYLGVQLFFIISGFVIFMTISYVKSGFEFVYKRFVRLYPIFWICLIFTFFITSISDIERFERSWSEFVINFSMIPGILQTRLVDGVYWSLVPELFFYGFIWLIYKLGLLNKIEIVSVFWLVTAIVAKFLIGNSVLNILVNAEYCYLFMAGIHFYKIYTKKESLNTHLLILATFIFGIFVNTLPETLICFFFYLIFYLLSYRKLIFLKSLKLLVFIGVISYPLYLIHQFFGLTVINKLNEMGIDNYFILLFLPILLSILISWLITIYIEKPILTKIKKIPFKLKQS